MTRKQLALTLVLVSACTSAPADTTVDTSPTTPSLPTTTSTTAVNTTQTTEPDATTTPSETSGKDQICIQVGQSMLVDESCFDRPWPFSIEQGTVVCDADAVTFESGGVVYSLNGLARTRELGLDPEPIWLDNPEVEGFKISIGPMIDLGLTLCE